MGFVKLSNELKKWAWINDPKTVYIYVRLLLGAAWQETDVGNVHLRRGEIAISQRKFAAQCFVTHKELRTALERLITTQKAAQRVEHKVSIITLLEYDCDALPATQQAAQKRHDNGTMKAQSGHNEGTPTLLNKKEKNIRNPEISAPSARGGGFSELFEIFWSNYPKKTAKQSALKAFEKIKPDEELLNKMLSSLEQQKKSVQWTKDNGQYIPYPANWLNSRRWEDELTEVKPTSKFDDNYGMPKTEAEWLEGFE